MLDSDVVRTSSHNSDHKFRFLVKFYAFLVFESMLKEQYIKRRKGLYTSCVPYAASQSDDIVTPNGGK